MSSVWLIEEESVSVFYHFGFLIALGDSVWVEVALIFFWCKYKSLDHLSQVHLQFWSLFLIKGWNSVSTSESFRREEIVMPKEERKASRAAEIIAHRGFNHGGCFYAVRFPTLPPPTCVWLLLWFENTTRLSVANTAFLDRMALGRGA